jgi:WD40 repeat protein
MHDNIIYCNADSRLILFSDEDGFRSSELRLMTPSATDGVISIAQFSTDSLACATSKSFDGILFGINGQVLRTFVGHTAMLKMIGKCSEHILCTSSRDHSLKIWDVRVPGAVYSLLGSNADCQAMHSTPDFVFGAYDDRTLRTWDLRSGRPKPIVGMDLSEIDPVALHYLRDVDKLQLIGVKCLESDDPLVIPLNTYRVYYAFIGQA